MTGTVQSSKPTFKKQVQLFIPMWVGGTFASSMLVHLFGVKAGSNLELICSFGLGAVLALWLTVIELTSKSKSRINLDKPEMREDTRPVPQAVPATKLPLQPTWDKLWADVQNGCDYEYFAAYLNEATLTMIEAQHGFPVGDIREALEACAKPPYKDSDLASLVHTLNVIARDALAKLPPLPDA